MDWDLKAPGAWDLAELEHDQHAAATAAAGPSGGHANAAAAGTGTGCRPPGSAAAPAECSVDLKLGGLGECGEPGAAPPARREKEAAAAAAAAAGKVASASPGAAAGAKRPRPGGQHQGQGQGQQQCPSCAVEGCKADLSKCRDYHRRHKVCEAHSKAPVVLVAGLRQRFCQQCSR